MRLFPKDRDLSDSPERVELRVRASDLRVPVEEVNVRLDHFLAMHMAWRSRASIQNLIRDGSVLLDPSTPDHPEGSGALAVELRPGRHLKHGSRVVIVIPEHLRLPAATLEADGLPVLFEDDCVVAIDKPPGLAVHPAGRYLTDTLIQRVHAMYRCDEMHRDARPRLCHRLDRETSGVILIGKDPISHNALMRDFEERRVAKEYLAIVQGCPEASSGTVDLPIGPARASAIGLKMAIASDGQSARTEWRILERYQRCTLLSCRPLTGRQHQIRVHMEAIGHPLVGDKLYGYDETIFQREADGELTRDDVRVLEHPRQALHNHRLEFTTPGSGERVVVESPLADDLATFLAGRSVT